MSLEVALDLRTAADRLGVHYQTAYRWVRDGTLAAVKVHGTYVVDEVEIDRCKASRSAPQPPPVETRVRAWEPHVARLHGALRSGDRAGASAVVGRLHAGGIPPVQLCDHLIAPAMAAIGDDWEAGRLTVAEEHRASAISEAVVAGIAGRTRGRPRGVALVAAPAGEAHSLPVAMASAVLEAEHWQVHHLGADVPHDDLVDLAERENAHVVVLSVTMPHVDAAAVTQQLKAKGIPALVGGPGRPLSELVAMTRKLR
jgi:MerR family transcriptional regulator, light-induced transcriptional regulator